MHSVSVKNAQSAITSPIQPLNSIPLTSLSSNPAQKMPLHITTEKLRKLASLSTKQANQAFLFYLSAEGQDRESADQLLDILLYQKIKQDYNKQIFLDPPHPAICSGKYKLGTVIYPPNKTFAEFGLEEKEWIRHILIVGMSGQGKTNLCFKILEELIKNNKPFLIFDWKKSYRDLLQLPQFQNLQVYTAARKANPFHFNPLIPPPQTDPGEWLVKLVDVMAHAFFEGAGAVTVLTETLDWLYEKCGMYDSTPRETPFFKTAQEYLTKKVLKSRDGLWKSSAMRALKILNFPRSLGKVVNPEKNWNHKKILNSNVILEFDALSSDSTKFLTESLILWLYEYRKNEANREKFKHCLLVEEAHHIFNRDKENKFGGETIMETCIRQIRELGQACVIIDQLPTKISDSLIANTYTKIAFNLGSGKDIKEISECMGLDAEEEEYIHLLPTGHAVVRLKDRVFAPLHVAFPEVRLQKGLIKDTDLKAIQ